VGRAGGRPCLAGQEEGFSGHQGSGIDRSTDPGCVGRTEATPEKLCGVLEAIGDGATMPSLRSSLDDVKYTEILVSVRVLIDSGHVTAESHGRGTTYKRVKGAKVEEVKNDA
jgi:hypothetical protein